MYELLILAAATTAFVDVNVLPMDSQRVPRHQTVVVENDLVLYTASGVTSILQELTRII